MSEKKFCKSCEYYYSEMFTCPICYGEQRERERIIKLLTTAAKAQGQSPQFLMGLACAVELIEGNSALIKGETE